MKQGVFLDESDRQILMRILTDCVNIDLLNAEERDRFVVIVQTVGLAAAPKPVGPDENIGSCEPSPMILWDKTQGTWYTEVRNVGQYALIRTKLSNTWYAYLNNKLIQSVPGSVSVDVIKRDVESRIITAHRINKIA